MLKRKDLLNRVYEGRNCIRFEVNIPEGTNEIKANNNLIGIFTRKSPTEWKLNVFFDRTDSSDTQVYEFNYIMPREDLSLELIAATGLNYFQLQLKEEIQTKINYDFSLGEIIR